MKNLVDIYEKLDINKVNIKDKGFVKNFPLDGTLKEIASYLKDHNFKEIPWSTTNTFFGTFKKDVEKESGIVFTRYKNKLIRFANTSNGNEIDDDNPIFAIYYDKGLPNPNQLYFESDVWWQEKVNIKDDFLAKMKKVFGNK